MFLPEGFEKGPTARAAGLSVSVGSEELLFEEVSRIGFKFVWASVLCFPERPDGED